MCSWLKKIFGGKCNCDHCGGGAKEEAKQPVTEAPIVPEAPVVPTPEVKPEAAPEENSERVQ